MPHRQFAGQYRLIPGCLALAGQSHRSGRQARRPCTTIMDILSKGEATMGSLKFQPESGRFAPQYRVNRVRRIFQLAYAFP